MAKFPNQRRITVHRTDPYEKNKEGGNIEPYVTIKLKLIEQASNNIGGEVAFKLWLYLAGNQDKYSFDFSSTYFRDLYGCSIDATKRAVNQLVELGYLVPRENKNGYDFYEVPQTELNFEPEKRIFTLGGKSKIYTKKELYDKLKDKFTDDQLNELWEEGQRYEQ